MKNSSPLQRYNQVRSELVEHNLMLSRWSSPPSTERSNDLVRAQVSKRCSSRDQCTVLHTRDQPNSISRQTTATAMGTGGTRNLRRKGEMEETSLVWWALDLIEWSFPLV